MSKTNNQHLEMIKDAIKKTDKISDSQKASSVKIVEEWILEDKAVGSLKEKLLEMSIKFEPILAEIGLL
jgi:hypothetical protein